jgi:hypothetical protein
MHKGNIVLAIFGFAAAIAIAGAAEAAMKLTADDYLAIERLTANYPYEIDHCSNKGYDYADQYTADATFGVSSDWGAKPKIWYRGREELAEADGGGKDGCKPSSRPAGYSVHHIVTSQVITPTETGAKGKSTLLSLSSGNGDQPPKIEWQGGYEDTYVKTPTGWKFKTRVHVWPGHDWPDTAAEQNALFQKQYDAMKKAKK